MIVILNGQAKMLYLVFKAPQEWNKCIIEFLTSIGFQQTDADPCIYKRTEIGPDNKEHFSMVALNVDDLIIAFLHPKE